jgi:hypothetical protein
MAINSYDRGALIKLTATFKNDVGTLTDPTTVVVTVVDPLGATTNPSASKSSTGIYTVTVDLTNATPGTWTYKFQGTGTCQAAEWAAFYVEKDGE